MQRVLSSIYITLCFFSFISSPIIAQHIKETGSSLGYERLINNANEIIWNIRFNYNATTVTGTLYNSGVIYIPSINKLWTSNSSNNVMYQWNADGTLDEQFTVPFGGTVGMAFDGFHVYCATNSTLIQKIDPVTRLYQGPLSIPVTPNGAKFIAFDPDADGGNGGIVVGNSIEPNLNFYVLSLNGALLRTISNNRTKICGLTYDKWSYTNPKLWIWVMSEGTSAPQKILQMDYITGVFNEVEHDVMLDVGSGQAGYAGGLFITNELLPGKIVLGGMLRGNPNRLFGYELDSIWTVGPGPATNPNPSSGAANLPLTLSQLNWQNPAATTSNQLFFGTSPGSLAQVQNSTPPATSWNIPSGTLFYQTTYYWRVDELDSSGTTTGSLWSFTTQSRPVLPPSLFYDNFDGTASSWTIFNDPGNTAGAGWQIENPPVGFYTIPSQSGGVFAANIDRWGSGSAMPLSIATLVTPLNFTSPPYNPVWLEWDNDFRVLGAADEAHVELSTDGGTNWITVWSKVGVSVRNTHEYVNISSSVIGQSSVLFRLRCIQPGWDWWWAIDNFSINGEWLPVELTSFTASAIGNNVVLNWSTATETNNYGFEIQRKSGNEFEEIGFVEGNGSTTIEQTYSFTDSKVSAGNHIYRLKQIDFDGTYEYSDTVEVSFMKPTVFSLEQNYPNPFNPSTKINYNLPSDAKVTLKVFDVLGQEVKTLVNNTINAGSHEVTFDASNLNSGVYFYTLYAKGIDGKNFTSTKKMILTK